MLTTTMLRSTTAIPKENIDMLQRPTTTADKLRSEIAQLRADFNELKQWITTKHDTFLEGIANINMRLEAVEEAVTKPEVEHRGPPEGYVSVKSMMSLLDMVGDKDAAVMARFYARSYSQARGLEVWVDATKQKAYEYFAASAAEYAIDRVRLERAGRTPHQTRTDALFAGQLANGQ